MNTLTVTNSAQNLFVSRRTTVAAYGADFGIALQGGSIMRGWMANENEMIACCSDGTRPVIFKIERIDYDE